MEVSTYITARDLHRLKRNLPDETLFMIFSGMTPGAECEPCLQVLADLPGIKSETYFLLIPGRSWHRSEVAADLLEDS
jgi:hypothetical protein